ncbi:hypothetical protein FHS43_006684 [Streptosporangium becharense]|nr:hypothetical protein [Streptosporangium becharense]
MSIGVCLLMTDAYPDPRRRRRGGSGPIIRQGRAAPSSSCRPAILCDHLQERRAYGVRSCSGFGSRCGPMVGRPLLVELGRGAL